MKPAERDVIVIGAGASGLICAVEAGRRGRSVLILEHNDRIGRKIRVSGGGRCNITNLHVSADNYISGNPHFCRSALAGFTPEDMLSRLRSYGIRYHEEEQGRVFCSRTSSDVIRMFASDCRATGVEVLLGCEVRAARKDRRFHVRTTKGDFSSASLVVATGGLSYPSLGASDTGYRIARSFGLAITPLRPALVPLRAAGRDLASFAALSGVSADAEISCGPARFRGPVLFTHHGLSGPAVLQISSYWKEGEKINIDLMPDEDPLSLLLENRRRGIELRTLLGGFLPKRLSAFWCARYAPSRPLAQYSDRELEDIAGKLRSWTITPSSTSGYDMAEVTLGGVDTTALSSKTMEAREVPGLYFTGEALDVTGQLGGYNLHWAWASGYAAGRHV